MPAGEEGPPVTRTPGCLPPTSPPRGTQITERVTIEGGQPLFQGLGTPLSATKPVREGSKSLRKDKEG